jgi:hypothetical protein
MSVALVGIKDDLGIFLILEVRAIAIGFWLLGTSG